MKCIFYFISRSNRGRFRQGRQHGDCRGPRCGRSNGRSHEGRDQTELGKFVIILNYPS
jgi:hypothetical protein